MKRNPDFLLRQVAGKTVLVPVGGAARAFPGMVDLNNTGKFLWEQLSKEQTLQTLVAALLERYDVDAQRAQTDVQVFLKRLQDVGAVTE